MMETNPESEMTYSDTLSKRKKPSRTVLPLHEALVFPFLLVLDPTLLFVLVPFFATGCFALFGFTILNVPSAA
jgi:hypothetical protein